MSITMWILWAVLCIVQNFSFTFVSRARNSGSLKRHIVAGIASNGVWFIGMYFAFSAMLKIISGAFGIGLALFAGAYYTVFTLTGSVLAHYFSLKTEKGKSAVGANKKYAQITVEEWEQVKNSCKPLYGKVPGCVGYLHADDFSKPTTSLMPPAKSAFAGMTEPYAGKIGRA